MAQPIRQRSDLALELDTEQQFNRADKLEPLEPLELLGQQAQALVEPLEHQVQLVPDMDPPTTLPTEGQEIIDLPIYC